MKKKDYIINYNEIDDILYVLDSDLDYQVNEVDGDYMEVRNSVSNKLLGYVIFNYSKHTEDIKDMPWRETNFNKEIYPKLKGGT